MFCFFFLVYDLLLDLLPQAECYHYLFDAAIKLYQLGLDWSTPDHGPIKKYGGKTNMSVKAGTVNSNHETEPSRVSSWILFFIFYWIYLSSLITSSLVSMWNLTWLGRFFIWFLNADISSGQRILGPLVLLFLCLIPLKLLSLNLLCFSVALFLTLKGLPLLYHLWPMFSFPLPAIMWVGIWLQRMRLMKLRMISSCCALR